MVNHCNHLKICMIAYFCLLGCRNLKDIFLIDFNKLCSMFLINSPLLGNLIF